jgi:hypothetical protein
MKKGQYLVKGLFQEIFEIVIHFCRKIPSFLPNIGLFGKSEVYSKK